MEVLLQHGAHTNARDNCGRTALHFACCLEQYAADVCGYLADCGALLDAADTNGNTPLHLATVRNATDVVSALLGRGARPTAANGQGATPLHFAAIRGHADALRSLLQAGGDPNVRATDGDTALDKAVAAKSHTCVAILREYGAEERPRSLTASVRPPSTPPPTRARTASAPAASVEASVRGSQHAPETPRGGEKQGDLVHPGHSGDQALSEVLWLCSGEW